MAFIVTDAGDSEGGYLPEIIIVYLGNRDVEPVCQPRGNGFQDPSLVFEGTILRYPEPDMTNADVHGTTRFQQYFVQLYTLESGGSSW